MSEEFLLFGEKGNLTRSFFKNLTKDIDEATIAQVVSSVLGNYCSAIHGFDSLPVFGTNQIVAMPIRSAKKNIKLVVNSTETIAQKALVEIVFQCAMNDIGLQIRYSNDVYQECQIIC